MGTTPIWSYIIDNAEAVVTIINSAEAALTIIAIVIAGIVAWRNGIIFRHRSPHINITHEVNHRAVSDRYNHLAVTITLHNSSRVKVEFRDGLFVLQQVAPMGDDEVERLYYSAPEDPQTEDPFAIQWETLEEIWSRWNKDEFSVEPGETATYTVEFATSWVVESVLITTYLYNSRTMGKIDNALDSPVVAPKQKRRLLRWLDVEGSRGWTRVTAYDIVPNYLEIGIRENE